MGKDRLAAFSDGVIAIIITIMVLELKVPHGADWNALAGVLPNFTSYVLSFIYLAIYWNNHHHLLHTVAILFCYFAFLLFQLPRLGWVKIPWRRCPPLFMGRSC